MGWDPTTIPLQLSALVALSACSFENKTNYVSEVACEYKFKHVKLYREWTCNEISHTHEENLPLVDS